MRFLSYFLLFAVAVSVPSAIRAQYDDNVVHINAVSMPFIVADASNVIDNQNTLQTGTLIAPSLVYSQDHQDDSPIVSSLTSPMLIAVDAEGEREGDEEGLEGQSLLIDYRNDDRNTIDLFTTINEELHENGVESLLETMDSEDMMIASAPIEGDDDTETEGEEDDIDAFDIAAAEGEGEGISESEEKQMKLKEKKEKQEKKYRRGLLRRGLRKGMMRGMRRFAPWRRFGREKGLPEGLGGRKRLQTMLKLMVLSKKLKALDMKMNLMRLLTRAIRMRMMEKGMGRGMGMDRGMVSLRNLRNKMMKKLMVLKLVKLMHLLYQSTLGRPVYHRSGMRLSSRFLLRHLLRHALRRPLLARMLLGLRAKSFTMRSVMRSFLNNLKYLLRKVFLLKKKEGAAGNRHRLFVRADRAIVNVGDGNEFKPIFYRSRAAPRVSVDDSTIPVRINVPAPGVIRRLYPGRTGQERRSDY